MSDELPQTIGAVVTRAAERFGDAEAFVDGDVSLSYVGLAAEVERAARAFIASGIEPGDRVAIWAPNMPRVGRRPLGLHTAGAVLVPLNTRFKGHEAAYILGKARARMLFTVTGFLDTDYVAMLDGADGPRHASRRSWSSGATWPTGPPPWSDFLARADQVVRADAAASGPPAIDGPTTLSDILFTSGTTGQPKGAMLRHAPAIRAYDAWSDVVGLRRGDRYLIINPFFHAFGYKAGILACLIRGATIVPQRRLRRARGDGAGRRGTASRCCPGHRRSTRRSSTTPTSTAST